MHGPVSAGRRTLAGMATLTSRNVNLSVEQETIFVDSWAPEPVPQWKYVDAAGHGHFREAAGYPTLREITETMVDPDDGDEWQAHVRWECPHCGEHIVPGTRQSTGRSTIVGAKRYYVDGREVDRDTFLAAWRPLAEQELSEKEADL